MSKANERRGEDVLTLDGVDYLLRPSYEAIETIERETGYGLLALAGRAEQKALTSGEVAIIAAELIRAGAKATNDDMRAKVVTKKIGEMIFAERGGQLTAQFKLQLVLLLAATGGYTPSGEVSAAAEKSSTSAAA